MADPGSPHPCVEAHVERLREARIDIEAFFDALARIRDDPLLQPAQRHALYRMVACESFAWYLEALREGPLNRIKLNREVAPRAEARAARKKNDVGTENQTPQRAARDRGATIVDRPHPRCTPRTAPGPRGPKPVPRAVPRPTPQPRRDRRDDPTRIDRPPPPKKKR